MPQLIVIAGLPGSGKSHRVKTLARKQRDFAVEDFMKGVDEDAPIRRSPRFTDSQYYPTLIHALRNGVTAVIADIVFCDTLMRLELKQVVKADVPGVKIQCEFFENAPSKCIRNVKHRCNSTLSRELRRITQLSAKYHIPQGVKPMRVWSFMKSRRRRE